jgi:hypothetical protein
MIGNARLNAILLGGFIAGTVDLGAATLISRKHDAVLILHVIASGLMGLEASLAGGFGTAVLGLVLQWVMALIIAAVFVVGAGYLPVLRKYWLAAGLAYGVVIFFVMNYVVVPLSALHQIPQFTVLSFTLNMIAMLVFGVVVAWFARES